MTSTAGDASTTGSTQLDGSVPSRPDDAGEEDPFADLFGDGGLFGGPAPSPDPDASMPPPTGGGEWALNPDSAAECPQEPPPIPLLGGPCLGIYYACGWTNQSGATYSCICDWVHWLCI